MLDIKTIKLRTESEIISSLKDKEKIVVSIVCATYNHELYIEDAITGFLMQETDFAFEIIIHDDASTDKTASIIRRYQKRYPNIIKPIFQTENQYSKGGVKPSVYASNFARGEYVALCEGDDYWCHDQKLQKQYNSLSRNEKYNLSVHSAFIKSVAKEMLCSLPFPNDGVVATCNFVAGGGGYVATCSIFVRKIALLSLPEWFFTKAPVGDYFIQVFSSFPCGAIYLNEVMGVYREDAKENWTSRVWKQSDKVIAHRIQFMNANLFCERELACPELNYSFDLINMQYFGKILKDKLQFTGAVSVIIFFIKTIRIRWLHSLIKWKFLAFIENVKKR